MNFPIYNNVKYVQSFPQPYKILLYKNKLTYDYLYSTCILILNSFKNYALPF